MLTQGSHVLFIKGNRLHLSLPIIGYRLWQIIPQLDQVNCLSIKIYQSTTAQTCCLWLYWHTKIESWNKSLCLKVIFTLFLSCLVHALAVASDHHLREMFCKMQGGKAWTGRDLSNQNRTRFLAQNIGKIWGETLGKSWSKPTCGFLSQSQSQWLFFMNGSVTATFSCCFLVAGLLGPKKYLLFKYLVLMSLDFRSLFSLSLLSVFLNSSISSQHMRSMLQTNLNRMLFQYWVNFI